MWFLHKWLISKLALPDDDEVMVKRKKVLLWFFLVQFLFGTFGLFITDLLTARIAGFIATGGNGLALVWLFVNKKPSDTFVELMGFVDLIIVIFVDLNAMGAMIPRMWAFAVIVVDVLLVCRVRRRSSVIVVFCLCLWLLLTTAETITRFGLLDIGGSDFNGDSRYRNERVCNCEALPCKRSAEGAGLTFFVTIAIFLLDFYFTRGFAEEVLAEKRKLELGVLAARDVASFLAGFKLEEAGVALEGSRDDLPDKLHEALHTILVNLRSYKPYLPQSCILGLDAIEELIEDEGPTESFTVTQSRDATHTQSRDATRTQSQKSHIPTESQSHTQTPSVQSELQNSLTMMLTPIRATMLVMNMRNSIVVADADPVEFTRLHTKMTGLALNVIRAQKGMLDLFVGDHVHASFNAARRCLQHALAAVKTAIALKQEKMEKTEVNIGVCGGKVLVGDLGDHEVRRFSIMGHAAVLTSVYERLGAEWGIGVVCNTAAYMDASVTQEMRIVLKAVTFIKCGKELEAVLWEAVTQTTGVNIFPVGLSNTANQEWMYALEQSVAKHWSRYNEAAKLYLLGECLKSRHAQEEAVGLLESYRNEPLAAALIDIILDKVPVETRRQVY